MAKKMTRWIKSYEIDPDHEVVGIKTGMTAYWDDLVKMAAWFDGYDGLDRGQLRASRRFLAARWAALTEKQIRRFLDKLVHARMLEIAPQKRAHDTPKKGPRMGTTKGQALSVYTIVNYAKYQGGDDEGANERAHDGAHDPLKKGPSLKKRKEIKDSTPLPPSQGDEHPALPMLADADRANGVDPATPLQADPGLTPPEPAVAVAAETPKTRKPRQGKNQTLPEGAAKLAIERWNTLARDRGLDPVTFVNKVVEGHVKARLEEVGGIEGWESALRIVEQSPFLLGKVSSRVPGKKPFKATLSWVTGPQNFAKVMNGSYLDAKARAPVKPAAPREPSPYDHPEFG